MTDNLRYAVAYLGPTQHFAFVNPAFEHRFGRRPLGSDAVGFFSGMFSPPFEQFINRALAGREVVRTLVYSNRDPEGGRLWLYAVPDVVGDELAGAFVMLEPVAERDRDEIDAPASVPYDQLVHLQRMARLGQIMAGMAHEVGQPVSAIINYADALPRMLDAGESPARLHSLVRALRAQADRASRIITQTRQLLGGRQAGFQDCDLLQVIYRSVELTERSAVDAGVEVRVSAQSPLLPCAGNPAQLEQILINLIGNAINALANESRRIVRVQAENVEDRAIRIRITDSGPGIGADALQSVFEPCQSSGGGMGMGLFVSRQLAEAHGGQLWAEPNRHAGASFVLDLPATSSQRTLEQASAS
ncbi:ATP-binding protein [Salinisphaera hydrothermalis]|uniref:ATP-binding protein n=1 Tax=Salinisphaera hydrothermalis TaxID=563188 RepID=UPI0018DBC657|nr:ATP-binding protein [Salinisphaera hydrothermalis]